MDKALRIAGWIPVFFCYAVCMIIGGAPLPGTSCQYRQHWMEWFLFNARKPVAGDYNDDCYC